MLRKNDLDQVLVNFPLIERFVLSYFFGRVLLFLRGIEM